MFARGPNDWMMRVHRICDFRPVSVAKKKQKMTDVDAVKCMECAAAAAAMLHEKQDGEFRAM